MKLSPQQHAYVAQRAQWYFDVAFSPRTSPMAFGDHVVFTGQGLSDLNRTISAVSNPSGPWGVSVTCEVGTGGTVMLGNAFPVIRNCDIQDIYAIKEAYIAFYGSVDKPSAFRGYASGAFQTDANGSVVGVVVLDGTAAIGNTPYQPT